MKIRTGFVSNSSSSSFLIGIPKDKETKESCPCCGRKDISLIEMLSNNSTNETKIDYSQEELFFKINNEIKEHIQDIYLLETFGVSYLRDKFPFYVDAFLKKGMTEQELVEKDKTDWKNELEEMKKYKEELEKAAELFELYKISVDYSDRFLEKEIRRQMKSGNIIDLNWIGEKHEF